MALRCKCTKRSWSEDGAVPGAQKNKEVFGRQRLARERKSENDRHFLFFALEAKKEITSRGKTGSFFLFLIFLSSLVHQQIYRFCLQKAEERYQEKSLIFSSFAFIEIRDMYQSIMYEWPLFSSIWVSYSPFECFILFF